MKKILVINNKYKTFGGEDSNIIDELDFLKNYFIVEYLEFDNAKRITFNDVKAFFSNSNKSSNKALIEIINKFNPDIVYGSDWSLYEEGFGKVTWINLFTSW